MELFGHRFEVHFSPREVKTLIVGENGVRETNFLEEEG